MITMAEFTAWLDRQDDDVQWNLCGRLHGPIEEFCRETRGWIAAMSVRDHVSYIPHHGFTGPWLREPMDECLTRLSWMLAQEARSPADGLMVPASLIREMAAEVQARIDQEPTG